MNPVAPWMHDRPIRNRNPGDLRPRGEAPAWPGQDDLDTGAGGPFAVFITDAEGWASLGLWCLDARYLRGMRTAAQMIGVFAPPTENDTAAYTAGIVAKVGAGSLDLSVTPTLRALCQAIAKWEESHPIWTPAIIDSGMVLCASHWPAFRATRIALAPPAAPAPQQTADELNLAEIGKLGSDTT